MSENKKQFGVWMDSHHATVTGRKDIETGEFVILNHIKNNGASANSNEKSANNEERTKLHTFFKEITSCMPNVTNLYVTGTGTAQEQFMHYLAETPQYKNAVVKIDTSNKMSDEKMIEYISEKFN